MVIVGLNHSPAYDRDPFNDEYFVLHEGDKKGFDPYGHGIANFLRS